MSPGPSVILCDGLRYVEIPRIKLDALECCCALREPYEWRGGSYSVRAVDRHRNGNGGRALLRELRPPTRLRDRLWLILFGRLE